MHQQGPHPARHPAPGRQATGLGLNRPTLLLEQLVQLAQGGGRIGGGNRFRQGELAQLARRLVVDPAQGGLQGGPLAPPAAQDQSQAKPGQQGQKPAARIHMIKLQAQHRIALEQAQPGLVVIELVIEGAGLLLGHQGTEATADRDHQQQADRYPQVGDHAEEAAQLALGEVHGLQVEHQAGSRVRSSWPAG